MKAVAERNSNIVLVQIDPDPSGETPFDQTRGVIVDMRRRTVSEPAYVQSILRRGYWVPFQGDSTEAISIVASLTAAGFDESKHRRWPKGTKEQGKEGGGRFAPKEASRSQQPAAEDDDDPGPSPYNDWLKPPAETANEAHYKTRMPREAVARARVWLEENGVTEHNGIPLNLLNAVGVVEAMNENFADGYEQFLSLEIQNGRTMHKEDFQARYKTADNGNAYVPERQLFHDGVAARVLADAKPPTDGKPPEAVFLAGGPASGKSSIAGKQKNGIFEGGVDVGMPKYAAYINPDDYKEIFPESAAMKKHGDWRWATLAHEESSDLAAQIREQAVAAKVPMVIDGTGDAAPGKFLKKIRDAEAEGYRTKVVFVDIPTEEALVRAEERAAKEKNGRKVAPAVITSTHENVTARHLEWRDEVDDWEVWANDDDDKGGRRMIARRVNGGALEILEPARYAEMLKKAKKRKGGL